MHYLCTERRRRSCCLGCGSACMHAHMHACMRRMRHGCQRALRKVEFCAVYPKLRAGPFIVLLARRHFRPLQFAGFFELALHSGIFGKCINSLRMFCESNKQKHRKRNSTIASRAPHKAQHNWAALHKLLQPPWRSTLLHVIIRRKRIIGKNTENKNINTFRTTKAVVLHCINSRQAVQMQQQTYC